MVLALTATVDIPLNNELAALGPTEGVRDFSLLAEFTGTWETADIARTVLCCAGLLLGCRALFLHGRYTAPADRTTLDIREA
ncbi:hypothetical protein ACFWMQ_19915 [Streptomyces sp. NPDC058372]|uniref:hypothetical protein n=1 Tax=unclassified Streptomyces TaxID=2593676 RepID=UPI003659B58F